MYDPYTIHRARARLAWANAHNKSKLDEERRTYAGVRIVHLIHETLDPLKLPLTQKQLREINAALKDTDK